MGFFNTDKDKEVEELKESLKYVREECDRYVKLSDRTKENCKASLEEKDQECDFKVKSLEQENALEIEKLQQKHLLELETKDFEIKHNKDVEIKKAKDELTKMEQENAVLKKENEMLVKITDLNGDVLDVKELVASLVKKLPTIDLKSINVTTTGTDK